MQILKEGGKKEEKGFLRVNVLEEREFAGEDFREKNNGVFQTQRVKAVLQARQDFWTTLPPKSPQNKAKFLPSGSYREWLRSGEKRKEKKK